MRIRSLALVAGAAALAACSDSTSPGDPGSQYANIQLNATTAAQYIALGTTASAVTVGDPTTSSAWDLSFSSSPTVAVNGGASGPGSVKAYCLCANTNLALTQVEALTATNGATAFGAVTAANIPADSLFQLDASSQAIDGWYDYNPSTHAITASSTVWGVRLATTSGGYAKFHVTSIPSAGMSNAGPVTIEWATQATASGTLGTDHPLVVDLTSGAKVYVNLTAGTTSATSTSPWDMALQGYTINVNGGSSGSGNVGAIQLVPSSFYASYAAVTTVPAAGGIPASAFAADGAGGAFLANEPYRYDGTSHQIYPTYDVYLVKKGTAVYKVQVINYYNTAGVYGNITVRYEKISG